MVKLFFLNHLVGLDGADLDLHDRQKSLNLIHLNTTLCIVQMSPV